MKHVLPILLSASLATASAHAQKTGSPEKARVAPATVTTESVRAQNANVTLSLEDAQIHEVIREIARISKASVVVGDNVAGRVSMQLKDVPWRQALESSVGALGFRVDESGGILRVVPSQKPTKAPRVYFAFDNADIRQVLDTIAKISGANIVVAPAVQGKITMRLRDISWQKALEACVQTLGYELQKAPGPVYRVVTPRIAKPTKQPKVSLSFVNTDIRKVVDSLAKLGSANIVLAPEVQGTISLRFRDIGWNDALNAAVETLGFRATVDGAGIYRVK